MFKTKAASKLDSSSSHFQSVSFDSDDFEEPSFKKIKSQLYTSEKFTKETLLKKRGSVSGNELKASKVPAGISMNMIIQKPKETPLKNPQLQKTFSSSTSNLDNCDSMSQISISNIRLRPENMSKKFGQKNNEKETLPLSTQSIPSMQQIDWKREEQKIKPTNALNKTTKPSILKRDSIFSQKNISFSYQNLPVLETVTEENYTQFTIVQHNVERTHEQKRKEVKKTPLQNLLGVDRIYTIQPKDEGPKTSMSAKMTLKDYMFMAKCSSRKAAEIKRNDVQYVKEMLRIKTQQGQRQLQRMSSLKDIKVKYVDAKYKLNNRQSYELLKNQIMSQLEGIKDKVIFLQNWFQQKQTIQFEHLMQLYDIKNKCLNINQKFSQTTDKLIECNQILALQKQEEKQVQLARSQYSGKSSEKGGYLRQI